MTGPLRLALVWHFHQPDYTDPAGGAPSMPWTRLHALKDYMDMAGFLARHPRIRATFNVVPTLIDQIRSLASNDSRPDPFLALAEKDAASLSSEERAFIVGHFFSMNRERMAAGLPRLNELYALRGGAPAGAIDKSVVARFDDQAITDIQVLFHLAWSGPLLQADPLIAGLRAKGRGFDRENKLGLFERQRAFLGTIIPGWRRMYDSGQIELSVTPYYHPILPLLCDLDSASEALPGLRLPASRFRHPEDADLQLESAMDAFEESFGRRAAGGWPSEGAISEASLARMHAAGYAWAASDEDVLFASLEAVFPDDPAARQRQRAELLYRPWRHASGPVLLFRDHDLSDRIGFSYATRPAEEAAAEFVGRLLELRALLPDDGTPYVVSVILDGENAWEHYPDYGGPFFDALYGALSREESIETVTASQAADPGNARELPRVVAGSWIYRSLATWVGHPEKNRAWELLAASRDAVEASRGPIKWDDPAWRAILAAEGSDWFWWYGDDHPTEYGAEFDAGFRDKLRAAHEAAGIPAPASLDEPIRKGRARGQSPPSGPVEATVDGRVGDYFEWRMAGHVACVFGAMTAALRFGRDLFFGTDGRSLFVRIDPVAPDAMNGVTVSLRAPGGAGPAGEAVAGQSKDGLVTALGTVLELSFPLERLARRPEPVRFAVELTDATGASQRIPADGFVDLPRPDEDPSRFDWFV
jgi:alpha-amylase/alpha-mannosidase (GH57 family)